MGGIVFRRRSFKRNAHKWTPSIVQSCIPDVPSEQPSQHPFVKIRQA